MSAHLSKVRVLVADDKADTAQRVCSLLCETADVDVIGPARDGVEALEFFVKFSPDGAVLDFSMPELNGLQVLREIRASGRPCWVVILTSQAEPSIREACLAAGADHFLHKAFGLDALGEIVAAYVRGDEA
ncbi:response regulator [Phenylobacterium sp.]|uniref:response regulator n=1 Tax=Phenylobacterium sp. TaxID=1871053 RepID=UPI0035B20543